MTQVIIDDIIPRTQLVASVMGQTVFNTNWTADVASDVVVYARASAVPADDSTQLVQPTDYNVSLIGGSQTVRVTFLVGRTMGDIITIVRNTPAERLNLYINTNFTPSMLNQDFGILTLVDQQAQMYDTVINPGYNLSAEIDSKDKILPILGPEQVWRMNDAGTAIEAVEISTIPVPNDALYVLGKANASLPNAINLGALSSGILKQTVAGLVSTPAIAINGTDYYGPGTPVPIPISEGGTGAITASGARTSLGLGTIATQNANAVNITGGNADLTTGTVLSAPTSPTDLVNKTYADSIGTTISSYTFFVSTSTPALPNSINFGALTSGLLKHSVNTGVSTPATAIAGTDYWAPGEVITLPGLPTNPSDAASKAYVDAVATGITFQAACSVSTTANLVATYANGSSGIGATLTEIGNGAFTTDGQSPALNARVLVNFQSLTFQNGIYTVTDQGSVATPYILTRATDYDQPSEIQPGDALIVQLGTLYGGTLWFQTDTVTTIGTDPISFTKLNAIPLPVTLANGGTSASLTANNGGIVYSNSSTLAILAGTATAMQMLQSGASSAPAWSSSTWPVTTTVNQLLFSSSANVVGGLTSLANAGLLTNGSGVPAWVTVTGTGAPVLQTSPLLVTPKIGTINDTNGLSILGLTPTATAVNYLNITNAAAGGAPALAPIGTDTDIGFTLQTKGVAPFGFQTAGLTNQYTFYSGTGYQHATNFNFPSTAANRTLTFPDASGTVALTSGASGIVNSGLINQLTWYAASGTTVSGLATANSGVLVTSAGGVPSISTTLPNSLAMGTPASLVLTNATALPVGGINASGTPSSTTFLRGDGTWTSPTAGSGGLKSFQIFTTGTAQTYTRPAGITSILVEVVGGGGAGGGAAGSTGTAAGAGGGSGGYARLWVSAASSTYTYTVGAGGTVGSAGNVAGNAGGTTTFSASSLQATGGSGGAGGANTASQAVSTGGAAGVGSNGDFNAGGAPGGHGTVLLGSAGAAVAGFGGSSHYGGGAAPIGVNNGAAGANYGSGGSGGQASSVNKTGGAGSPGLIIVWEYS